MSDSLETRLSDQSRKIVLLAMWICIANYLLHLFPISLLSFLEIFPSEIKEQLTADQPGGLQERAERSNAWVELAIGLAIQVALAFLIIFFVSLRELVRLFVSGRNALSIGLKSYVMLYGSAGLAGWFLQRFVLGGFEAFAGTRMGGLGPALILLVCGTLALASFLAALMFLLEPRTSERCFNLTPNQRYERTKK